MHKIEKYDYGYKITLGGSIDVIGVRDLWEESGKLMAEEKSEFGVLVDIREMEPLSLEAQEYIEKCQTLFRERGPFRAVVIWKNFISMMQFQRIARQTGVYRWERYIDASTEPNWEQTARDWLDRGIDPDK